MAVSKLKEYGWYVSDDGFKKLSDDGAVTDAKELIKRALDIDIRELGGGGLSPDYAKGGKYDVPGKGLVLQIITVRNVSAPKCNEESKTSPRLLQIDLTDGKTICIGLELDPVGCLNVNLPPGMKILIKGSLKLIQGMFILTPVNVEVLGGQVDVLYEKWEQNRILTKYAKGSVINRNAGMGPPPWIPFGQPIQSIGDGKSFKSLNATKETGESKQNVEFIANRNAAIAEALKSSTRKTFGGGNRHMMDHNVKKIMDKGFTEEQAKTALKLSRNNLEKAMGSLKRREDRSDPVVNGRNGGMREERFGKFNRRPGRGSEESNEYTKPSNKVSLFDFLEDKIKLPEPTVATKSVTTATTTSSTTYPTQRENNYDHPRSAVTSSSGRQQNIHQYQDRTGGKPSYQDRYGTKSTDRSQPNTEQKSQNPLPSRPVLQKQNSSSSVDYNRSKFENNMSASFANRKNRDDHRDDGGKSAARNFGGYNSRPNYPTTNQRGGATMDSRPKDFNKSNGGRDNRPSYGQSKYGNRSVESKPYSDVKMNQLVDSTARMKIDSSTKKSPDNRFPPQKNQSVQSKQTAGDGTATNPGKKSTDFNKVFPQIANGGTYNPYKITGFQNKETNEFARNVLKGQGQFEGQPNPSNHKKSDYSTGQPNVSQAHQINQSYTTIVPNVFSTPPPPLSTQLHQMHQVVPANQYISMPGQMYAGNPSGWRWQIGDRCLAKYWEDGRYYNAKITALTETTCVVEYLEYGSYEEVLQSDCLPITDGPANQSVNYNQQFIQPAQSSGSGSHYQQQQQQQRFRNEQQMYVPPAQRNPK